MGDREPIGADELGRELREWSGAEPAVSEVALRGLLRHRLAARRKRPRLHLALVAAAASAAAFLAIVQSTRQPSPPAVAGTPEKVYETGDNVILVLRDDGAPIYIVKEVPETGDTP